MIEQVQTQKKENVTKGIGWITIGSLVFLTIFLNSSAYFSTLNQEKATHFQHLSSIAKSVASQIDGDAFQKVAEALQNNDFGVVKNEHPDFLQIQDLLQTAQTGFQLNALVYALSKNENGLFYVYANSEKQPGTESTHLSYSQEIIKNYDKGGLIEGVKNEQGKWFYAFEPVMNSNGEVVGTVVIETLAKSFGSKTKQVLYRNTAISIAVIILMAFLLNHFLKRVDHISQAKNKAEHTALIKAKFLSTMSHEIRTPMNAVIGLTNILIQENPRSDQIENLNTLKFSADLLLSLINDILDFSKIEAGKITFENCDFDLHLLIKNLRNSMKSKAEEKNLVFETTIDPAIPVMVKGDQVRLSQIITNLAANAIKFTHQGEVLIDLRLISKNDENTSIRFSVKDTGIGIPTDKFDKIFQSFSQADTDTTRKFGGTGLGLSITKKLLELQGSCIELESEVGKGSNFFFDLTFQKATEEFPVKKEETPVSNFKSFEGIKILLVEDNKINVLVAKKFLNKWNLNIDTAENGEIALEMVQNTDYKLVLMDLEMPVMDGYTATQKIRELKASKYKKLPIIALSASAISDFRTKAINVGMDEFVTKPFNPGELHDVISRFVKISA